MKEGDYIPNVNFMIRTQDSSGGDAQPYIWSHLNSYKIFGNQKSILFSLPGAFTPICTERQVPDFDNYALEFKKLGIQQVFCMSVNDFFVVKEWANRLRTKNIKFIPDGNGVFTKEMGMLVDKSNIGFGHRSWRYAAIINKSKIEKMFVEPGKMDNHLYDPYIETQPNKILEYLKNKKQDV